MIFQEGSCSSLAHSRVHICFFKYLLTLSLSQQKFKKLIESTNKYGLMNGKVVDLEDPDHASTPVAKKGRPKSTTSTPRSTAGRKRKATKKDGTDEDDSDVENGTPVKKTAKRTPRSTAKSVKAEAAESDDEDHEGEDGEPAGEKSGDDDEEGSDKEGGD